MTANGKHSGGSVVLMAPGGLGKEFLAVFGFGVIIVVVASSRPNSMKMLFITPPNRPFTEKGILMEPIDALGLATFARKEGADSSFLDMDAQRMDAQGLDDVFEKSRPEAVVVVWDLHIPLHTPGSATQVGLIMAKARALGIATVLTGRAATYWSEDEKAALGADANISGEPENGILEILKNGLPPRGSTIASARISNLDSLPAADRSMADLGPYIGVRSMLTSRGCHAKCSFCATPGFWGNWRGRSAHAVALEAQGLAKDFGAGKILFLDDNAMASTTRMEEICKGLCEADTGAFFGTLGSPDKATPVVLDAMARAGFKWVHFGGESGDSKIFDSTGKKGGLSGLKNAVAMAKGAGLRVRTSWIADLPGSTEKTAVETLGAILECGSEEVRVHTLAVRPGSGIWEGLGRPKGGFGYIHGAPSSTVGQGALSLLRSGLSDAGYLLVENEGDCSRPEVVNARAGTKIAAFRPLRYGLGWE